LPHLHSALLVPPPQALNLLALRLLGMVLFVLVALFPQTVVSFFATLVMVSTS
jgi:hypothetical protein